MRLLISTYRFCIVWLFFLSCVLFSGKVNGQKVKTPVAEKGIIDLRKTDLKQESIPLNGEWAFYWKQLITAKGVTATPSAFVYFPALWKNTTINNLPLTSVGYASYMVTVLLPKHQNKLALQVPDTYSSYRLFINGEEFCNNGSPDSIEKKAIPKWIEKTVEITTTGDTLHLLLQVANVWHSKGGPYKEIIIGDKEKLFLSKDYRSA